MLCAGTKTHRKSLGIESLTSRLERGFKFYTVEQENCRLVVFARNESQAIGLFRNWLGGYSIDTNILGVGCGYNQFSVTASDNLPGASTQFIYFAGRRGGVAQIKLASL
jgi:hypothetical protein